MQYKVSIKRKCYLLSVLLMTVWLTGCVQEEFESTPSPAGNGIRFTLTVPDVNLPSVSSRTMTGTGTAKKEDEIETVDILVFDMSKTPAVFLEWVSATGVTRFDLMCEVLGNWTYGCKQTGIGEMLCQKQMGELVLTEMREA